MRNRISFNVKRRVQLEPVYIISMNQDLFATARGMRWTVPRSATDMGSKRKRVARACEAPETYRQLYQRPLL
jgi:hypothetical protein